MLLEGFHQAKSFCCVLSLKNDCILNGVRLLKSLFLSAREQAVYFAC